MQLFSISESSTGANVGQVLDRICVTMAFFHRMVEIRVVIYLCIVKIVSSNHIIPVQSDPKQVVVKYTDSNASEKSTLSTDFHESELGLTSDSDLHDIVSKEKLSDKFYLGENKSEDAPSDGENRARNHEAFVEADGSVIMESKTSSAGSIFSRGRLEAQTSSSDKTEDADRLEKIGAPTRPAEQTVQTADSAARVSRTEENALLLRKRSLPSRQLGTNTYGNEAPSAKNVELMSTTPSARFPKTQIRRRTTRDAPAGALSESEYTTSYSDILLSMALFMHTYSLFHCIFAH